MANHASKFECKDKKRYAKKEDAEYEIFMFMVEAYQNYTLLRTYKCKFCKGWHLTSNFR